MVRRRLTLQQSLNAIKLFYQLLNLSEGKVTWHFWTIDQADLTALCTNYNLQELQDTPPPYRRSLKLFRSSHGYPPELSRVWKSPYTG